LVHDVYFSKDADGSFAHWVNFPRQLERIGISNIVVGGAHRHDDGGRRRNVLKTQVCNFLFDIKGLVSSGHFGDAWKVDEREVDHFA